MSKGHHTYLLRGLDEAFGISENTITVSFREASPRPPGSSLSQVPTGQFLDRRCKRFTDTSVNRANSTLRDIKINVAFPEFTNSTNQLYFQIG